MASEEESDGEVEEQLNQAFGEYASQYIKGVIKKIKNNDSSADEFILDSDDADEFTDGHCLVGILQTILI